MLNVRSWTLPRVLTVMATLLIVKVTVSVVLEYRRYLPPDFESDFLRGREAYFWGGYHWAFYTHLAAGPASLLLGTLLVSDRFRKWAPAWHRRLGRLQAAGVLLLLTPSGLWMAYYAQTGAVAAAGLGVLAIATAAFLTLGWRAAVTRRFADHQAWMSRTFILLGSAVVIRLIGGTASVMQWDAPWIYAASCWVSWLGPLVLFEVWRRLESLARGWFFGPRQSAGAFSSYVK